MNSNSTSVKRTIWTLSLAALALMTVMVAGRAKTYGATAADDKQPVEVKIDNFVFAPNTVTVPVGTTLNWTNRDDIPHNVVAVAGAFRSPALDTEDKFSFTFNTAGTFDYFCSLHSFMKGRVIVTP